MKIRIMLMVTIAAIAQMAGAANSLPVSNAWNIAPSGNATSSGELHFRMTAGDTNPVDITVPIMSGAKEGSIARYIQRALSSQLRTHHIDVEAGEGTNVILKGAGDNGFSVELVGSDVETYVWQYRVPSRSFRLPCRNSQPPRIHRRRRHRQLRGAQCRLRLRSLTMQPPAH